MTITDPPRPREEFLQLQDETTRREAKNFDDLAAQLRRRYPDSEYERTVHSERDHEAERRRADAIDSFIRLLPEITVYEALRSG